MKAGKSFSLSQQERNSVRSRVREILERESVVLFAYLYGSFVTADGFNDIDLAVWADETILKDKNEIFDYQLNLALKIEHEVGPLPVDVTVLNSAPLPLRFRVVSEGELLLSRDEPQRIEFESHTRALFFDFIPHIDFYYEKLVLGK